MEKISDRIRIFGEEDELPAEGPIVEDLLCESGLPILAQVVRLGDWGGISYSLHEILSIEETSLPDDLFEVPAGFAKKSMMEMWR